MAFACTSCGQTYPSLATIRILLPAASTHVEHWRQQLGFIIQQAAESNRVLEDQAADLAIGGATRIRLQALARAITQQVADLATVIAPVLGQPLQPGQGVSLPRGATDYLSYLFRDWAWSNGNDEENERSLVAIRRVTRGRDLGRMLVLGAGGCRLAYDLHVSGGATETAVVDIDPYLFIVAEAVVRGAAVSFTESSVNAPEVDPVSRRWTLSAPSGPLGPEAFRFFLADGTEPPFANETFDTVVTPWFIDQVPADLAGLLRRLHALLVPGGLWIHRGPLLYRPEALPIACWYTRQEIFDLAQAVGFRMGDWEHASQPCLVSPLTGRGLIENVLTFEAVRA
jgi:hypothetical protein